MKTALEHPPVKSQETLTYPKLRHQPPRGRFWESIDASGTVHIYREMLIPNFFTLVGLFIPAGIRFSY